VDGQGRARVPALGGVHAANLKEPIEITAPDRRIVLENCVRCHAA